MLAKNAVIGCQALHLLPGVVDDVQSFQRHTVIFVNFSLENSDTVMMRSAFLGNAAVLQAVPDGAQAVAAGRIKIAPGTVADIVNDCKCRGRPNHGIMLHVARPLAPRRFKYSG